MRYFEFGRQTSRRWICRLRFKISSNVYGGNSVTIPPDKLGEIARAHPAYKNAAKKGRGEEVTLVQ